MRETLSRLSEQIVEKARQAADLITRLDKPVVPVVRTPVIASGGGGALVRSKDTDQLQLHRIHRVT